ncbi:hypothetical protein OHB12_29130 [Nocardia sp. NBC_01730]|nr:hypothetical protein OHB12_29130 [Nocardia sp. NBC_01730]
MSALDCLKEHSREPVFAKPERLWREPQIGDFAVRIDRNAQLALTGARANRDPRESLLQGVILAPQFCCGTTLLYVPSVQIIHDDS